MHSLGCDIGGTFTDFALFNHETGEVDVEKCLTTPQDPSEGVFTGTSKLKEKRGDYLGETENVIHGTTLIINAIIERKGAKTALITTKGFRDIIEIAREKRYYLYDIYGVFPAPIVPRHRRREVNERIYSNGKILIPIKPQEVKRLLSELAAEGIESIAICLLHSYANPSHEELIQKIANQNHPGITTSISADVLPEIKEYERTTTTTLNAYTKPLINRYLTRLEDKFRMAGLRGKLYLMLSSSGIATVETARRYPVRVSESGPAAGVLAAQYYGKLAGVKDVLSFDMGGTTAKVSIIVDGQTSMASDYEVNRVYRFIKGSGIPLRIPVLDLMEIGAGGGSIAHISSLGLLQVGPESAGAEPGPACYARGGENPTVTDADLVLGYLNTEYFLGGEMKLDKGAAKTAIEERIAKLLGMDVTKTAWGIHDIVNENMAAAAKMQAMEKGYDPTRFTLFAFGGAGPVHATGIAKKLRIKKVIIPLRAGVASAIGFFMAPLAFDSVRTYKVSLEKADFTEIEKIFARMEREAKGLLGKVENQPIVFARSADMRYVGQGYEIRVPIPSGDFSKLGKANIQAVFDKAYEFLYGRVYPDVKIELMNFRLNAQLPSPPLKLRSLPSEGDVLQAIKGRRKAYDGESHSYIDFPVYDRYQLFSGATIKGPAIIEEKETTIVAPPNTEATVDRFGTIYISL